jgi:hypothetical protein
VKARGPVVLVVASAALVFGCGYGGGEAAPASSGCGEETPRSAGIDTAAELDITPGQGVGVFFEYLGGGNWRLTTTCDTPSSGYECFWDVIVWPLADGQIFDFASEGLEAGDAVQRDVDDSLHLFAYTDADSDGVDFSTTPGAPLRFDALLDGGCANAYMYWVGGGAVHTGSPSNPLDLVPTSE